MPTSERAVVLQGSRRWLLLALCAMVTVAAARQVRLGWADWHFRPAKQQIDAWMTAPQRGLQDTAAWRNALARLDTARRADPDQALYPLYQGLAYYVRVRGLPPGPAFAGLATPYLNESALLFTTAGQLNPRMGQVHAALAVTRGRQGRYDASLLNAYVQAERFAPFEPVTLAPMLSLGLAAWPYLGEPSRDAVGKMAERARRVSPVWYRGFAAPHLKQGTVCELSPSSSPCLQVP